jgi:putative endonuclease
MTTKSRSIGNLGEAIAAKYMTAKGYEFVERNFYAQGGEIDLIFKKPNSEFYIFVEVKTRSNDRHGDPKEFLNKNKLRRILTAGYDYFTKKLELETPKYSRVDGVFVRLHEGKAYCEHIENIGFGDFN